MHDSHGVRFAAGFSALLACVHCAGPAAPRGRPPSRDDQVGALGEAVAEAAPVPEAVADTSLPARPAIEDLDVSLTRAGVRWIGPPWHPAAELDVSADGERVAARRPAHVEVYDARTSARLFDISLPGHARAHRLTADGRRLAVLTDGPELYVWDLDSAARDPHRVVVDGLDGDSAILASSREEIAVSVAESGQRVARLIDLRSLAVLRGADERLEEFGSVVALSSDGRTYAVPSRAGAVVIDRATGQRRGLDAGLGDRSPGSPRAISENGRYVVMDGDGGIVLDRATGEHSRVDRGRPGPGWFVLNDGTTYAALAAGVARRLPTSAFEVLPCLGGVESIGVRADGTVETGHCAIGPNGSALDRWSSLSPMPPPAFAFADEDTVEVFFVPYAPASDGPEAQRGLATCSVVSGRCAMQPLASGRWPAHVLIEGGHVDWSPDEATMRALERETEDAGHAFPLGDGRVLVGGEGGQWSLLGPRGRRRRGRLPHEPRRACALGEDLVMETDFSYFRVDARGTPSSYPDATVARTRAVVCDPDRDRVLLLRYVGDALGPSSHELVAIGPDGTASATLRLAITSRPYGAVRSTDGARVALLFPSELVVVRLADLAVELSIDLEPYGISGGAQVATWSPSGHRLLAYGGGRGAWIWDAP